MSTVDAAWLGMDAPENLMVITAVLRFDEPVDWDRLRDVVGVRLLERYPVFRRRAVPAATPFEAPVWVADPDFSLDRHVTHVRLDGRGDDGELTALVGRLMGEPLDMRRSPWQLHLVDGYGGGSAVVARLHHCIADGIALAGVLLDLTDDRPSAPTRPAPAETSRPGRSPRRPGIVTRARAETGEVLEVAGVAVRRPRLRELLRAAGFGLDVLRTVVRVLCLSRDPRTRLSGRLGVRKVAAWTAPQRFDAVKAVAGALDATVNDVLLAATAGALRRHLLDHGERAHDLRVFVPVDLRRGVTPAGPELGNRFGLIFLRLPVAEPDPLRRVRTVHERVTSIRASSEAAATYAVLAVLGALPAWAHGLAVRVLGSKTTAIVSNVPGPRRSVFLAGARVADVVFWVPQAASLGLGVSIFSYAGTVSVGIAADAGLVDDADALARAVEEEVALLVRRTGGVPAMPAAQPTSAAGSAAAPEPARREPTPMGYA